MDLFENVIKTAKNIGNTVASSAITVGNAAQEQTEIVSIKMQINQIDEELEAVYQQIGKKYVDSIRTLGDSSGMDIADTLSIIEPKIEKKLELEKQLKDRKFLKSKEHAEAIFREEKEKLEKALAQDILTQEEYNAKLSIVNKKLDNFEEINKIEKQFSMGIITKEEKNEKIENLLM